jgi:hypothetical protein
VSLVIVFADGKLQSPKELRAQIMSPLKFIKCQKWFFALHRRQQALPPLGSVVAECSPCVPMRLMFRCVATACQRLAAAPADMHMAFMSWGCAEMVMQRVTRGRVKKVQVRLHRRACCVVRCACRASVRVCCVFDACCRKRWLVFRCVATLRSVRQSASYGAVTFHSCVQAAAAARVADGPDIMESVLGLGNAKMDGLTGDGTSVLCHVIVDADAVNKRDEL